MEDLSKVRELVEVLIKENGYELSNFNYLPKIKTLEIVVDRDDPISFDDITLISNKISDLLDEHDFTSDAYTLDVSSLGAEKPIKVENLDKYLNKYINIHLSNPYKGMNTLEGDLLEVTENVIVIGYRDKARLIKAKIERKFIDKARLAIKF